MALATHTCPSQLQIANGHFPSTSTPIAPALPETQGGTELCLPFPCTVQLSQ